MTVLLYTNYDSFSPSQGSPNPCQSATHSIANISKEKSSKVPSTLKANSAEQPLDKEMGT